MFRWVATLSQRNITLVSVLGWIIAGVLIALVALVIVTSYLDRNEGGCDPTCIDISWVTAFSALGLFGAVVSASIGHLQKPGSKRVKRAIAAGGVIFAGASVAGIFLSPGSPLIVFVLTSIFILGIISAGSAPSRT